MRSDEAVESGSHDAARSRSRFRTATESDAGAILELMRTYYDEEGYPLVEAESRSALLDLVRNEDIGCVWVVPDGPGIVGYLIVTLGFSLEYRGRDAFIDEVYVAEGSRGQGLGREALAVAERYARARGVKALHLEVEPHRSAALSLYVQAGFADHARRLMTKRLGDARQ